MSNESMPEKLPDRSAYLARIGLAGRALPLTTDTLNTMILNHLTYIPFENLSAWDRHESPALELSAVFDKLVLHRRGGWCFEQNALLEALLRDLGFTVYPVGVRVLVGRGGVPAVSHRAVICVLDGVHYYCDVGFGNELFRAVVPLDGALNPYGYFIRREEKYCVLYKNPDAPERVLMFDDRPFEPADFEYASYALATKPGLPFYEHLFVSILTPEGHRRLLFDSHMEETFGGQLLRSVEVSDRKALSALLSEEFGIEYEFTD